MDRKANQPEMPIVWIDDELDFLHLVRRAMRKEGFQEPVVCLESGSLAISYLAQFTGLRKANSFPAIILLDIRMPTMDGFEVLKWIKARPEFVKTPVVMLTGSDHNDDTERAKRLGAAAFYTKPASYFEILALVNEIRKVWIPSKA